MDKTNQYKNGYYYITSYFILALTYVNGLSDLYAKLYQQNPTLKFDDALLFDSQWHHITYTFHFGIASLYLDGILQSTNTYNHPMTNFTYNGNVDWVIGGVYLNNCSHNNNFEGLMDDIRIYEYGMSASEVEQLYYLAYPEYTHDGDNCQKTINFTNTSINATSYLWEFGDGNTSSQPSPSHTFASAGTYTVKLTAYNGGYPYEYIETITISNAPDASFTTSTPTVLNTIVQFTDNSSNDAVSWNWDFDNGISSTLQNPTITFINTGTYNVALTVTNNQDCSDTFTNIVEIEQSANIHKIQDENLLSIFPNPSSASFNIKYSFDGKKDIQVLIYNTLGEIVKQESFNHQNTPFNEKIAINNLSDGIYIIKLIEIQNETIHQVLSEKILIQQ